jgi:hypothetical protein
MMHKYSIGQLVCFEGPFQYDAARGQYRIVRLVPIEKDSKVIYRIKSATEAFDRSAEEYQLTVAPEQSFPLPCLQSTPTIQNRISSG